MADLLYLGVFTSEDEIENRAERIDIMRLSKWPSQIILTGMCVRRRPVFEPGPEPVSYTHLDVYKRQRDHSKNGTTVRETHLHKNEHLHRVEDGDVIRIGDTLAMVRYEPVKPDDADIKSLVGISLVMKDLRAKIVRAASQDSVSILLLGETGTGKEVVARAIHALSKRCLLYTSRCV